MSTLYKNILVPNDGSDNAYLALKHGMDLAKSLDAKLWIMRVVDTRIDPFAPYIVEGVFEEELEDAHHDMDQLAAEAKEYGVKEVYPIVRQGDPKEMIAYKMPQQEKIDLIVMGATGKGMLDKLLVGSTTSYVVRRAKCQVLVIHGNASSDE